MAEIPPTVFTWDGERMVPKHPKAADARFVVGEVYVLSPWEERSWASHGHYFACVNEAWKNLPEADHIEFPTPDHFRKKALIKTGFRNETTIECSSRAEALRWAVILRAMDDCAVVVTHGAAVTRYEAQSQGLRAMGKAKFQASKQAVLELLADKIGVSVEALAKHTKGAEHG